MTNKNDALHAYEIQAMGNTYTSYIKYIFYQQVSDPVKNLN